MTHWGWRRMRSPLHSRLRDLLNVQLSIEKHPYMELSGNDARHWGNARGVSNRFGDADVWEHHVVSPVAPADIEYSRFMLAAWILQSLVSEFLGNWCGWRTLRVLAIQFLVSSAEFTCLIPPWDTTKPQMVCSGIG